MFFFFFFFRSFGDKSKPPDLGDEPLPPELAEEINTDADNTETVEGVEEECTQNGIEDSVGEEGAVGGSEDKIVDSLQAVSIEEKVRKVSNNKKSVQPCSH